MRGNEVQCGVHSAQVQQIAFNRTLLQKPVS